MKTSGISRTSIPCARSSPDLVRFGQTLRAWDQGGTTFSFFGVGLDKIAFSTKRPHPFVFNALKRAGELILGGKPLAALSDHFNNYDVVLSRDATEEDVVAFVSSGQWHQDMGQTRINTRSGRFWRNLTVDPQGATFDVIAFWCREGEITSSDLKRLKCGFGLQRVASCAIGAEFFLSDGPV